jgi:hypothetical protein
MAISINIHRRSKLFVLNTQMRPAIDDRQIGRSFVALALNFLGAVQVYSLLGSRVRARRSLRQAASRFSEK